MQTIKELSETIVQTTSSLLTYNVIPGYKGTKEQCANENIENRITWYINDVLKVLKNINETSVNKQDRAKRLIDLEEKFGIPKTHSII